MNRLRRWRLSFLKTNSAARVDPRRTTRATVSVVGPGGTIVTVASVIKNEDFDGLDGENIPFDIQLEIAGLESLLSHYFPGQYPRRRWAGGDDDTN